MINSKVVQDPRTAKDIGIMIVDLMYNGFPADLFPKPYYLGNTIKGLPFMAGTAQVSSPDIIYHQSMPFSHSHAMSSPRYQSVSSPMFEHEQTVPRVLPSTMPCKLISI